MDRTKLDAWMREVKEGFGNVGKHRPSPAMVVALIALCISMGTSAYAAIQIPKNSVGAAQLKNNAVTAKKIKNGAVTKAKLAKSSVTASALAAGSVSYNSVQQGAIGRGSLIPGAVGAEQIEDGSVSDTKIKDQSVGEEKIKTGAIGGDKLKTGAVGSGKIQDGAVGEDKLASASVGTGKLKDGAVGPDKIADGSVDTAKINAAAITAGKMAAASVGVTALQALPSARKTVNNGGSQTIGNGTPFPVDVNYPTTVFDTAGLAPGANPERLVASAPGIYDFAANATWAAHNVGDREISVWKTTPGFVTVSSRIASQRIPATQGGVTPINLTGTTSLNAGEYLTVRAYQDSGGPLNLISTDGNIPTFSLTYLSRSS